MIIAIDGPAASVRALLLAQLQHRQESLLWHLDTSHLLHALLALLLLLKQLFLRVMSPP